MAKNLILKIGLKDSIFRIISDIVKNKSVFNFNPHTHIKIEFPLNPLHCPLTRDALLLTLNGDLD